MLQKSLAIGCKYPRYFLTILFGRFDVKTERSDHLLVNHAVDNKEEGLIEKQTLVINSCKYCHGESKDILTILIKKLFLSAK